MHALLSMGLGNTVVLAHQGGWDELILVGGPVLVFAGLLAMARRRALRIAESHSADDEE